MSIIAKKERQRIALIGASIRAGAFVGALKTDYKDGYEMVAVLDADRRKMRSFNEFHSMNLPTYTENEFERMLAECKPDIALITTTDSTHEQYIIKCLDQKVSCLVEKPLCINAEQCRSILAAQKRNPDTFARTMHNSRYHKTFRKVKELVDAGVVGKILNINYDEKLDLFHGSSYFRRWNRCKKFSGGLQITKSSHHFDKINWLLQSKPESVNAFGKQLVYGAGNSDFHGEKCSTCQYTGKCKFFLDASRNPIYNEVYYKNNPENVSSFYTPDLCVYDPEIDAEDYMNIYCDYENGVALSYTLNTYANYEGETLHIEGEKGRLEMTRHTIRCIVDQGVDKTLRKHNTLKLFRFGVAEVERFNVDDEINDNHGGCDQLIYADIFGNTNSGALATLEDGIQAVLIGIAANHSVAEGRVIQAQELLIENNNE